MAPPISHPVALAAADELKARIEVSKNVKHPGEVGRARENLVREFLTSFCPKGFSMGTGFVFDAKGEVSRQQDIVVYRDSYYPIFSVGGVQYYPIESVSAVLEVKSSVENRKVLEDALDCIASVKSLDRSGKGDNYIVGNTVMRVTFDPKRHEHQVFSALIAIEGPSSRTAVEVVSNWCRSHDRTAWPNGVVSAFKYSIYYVYEDSTPRCDPMLARRIASSIEKHPDNTIPILDFLGQLISFLRVAPIVDFRAGHYFPSSLYYDNAVALPLDSAHAHS